MKTSRERKKKKLKELFTRKNIVKTYGINPLTKLREKIKRKYRKDGTLKKKVTRSSEDRKSQKYDRSGKLVTKGNKRRMKETYPVVEKKRR